MRSFLISSALFWLEEYHADALRVDGVSSMLYLNFGVDDPARKKYNERGGEEDLAAVAFLQTLNTVIGKRVPGAAIVCRGELGMAARDVSAGEGRARLPL